MKRIILIMMLVLLLNFALAIEVPKQIDIYSGDTYNGKVIAKNYADNSASFILSISCDNPQVSGVGSEEYFNANEEKEMSFSLGGGNTNKEPLITSCTYKVTDRKSGEYAEESGIVIVKYDSGLTCSAGELSCDDTQENLLICDEDGRSKSVKEECAYGCIFEDGKAKCKDGEIREEKDSFLFISLIILLSILLIYFIIKSSKKKK